jgi:hypothetical protein
MENREETRRFIPRQSKGAPKFETKKLFISTQVWGSRNLELF